MWPKTVMKILAAFFVLLAVSCASTSNSPTTPATATVTINRINPRAGETVDFASVIDAEVEYSITNFSPSAEYFIAPLFDSTEGRGHTFNEYVRISDAPRISVPSGVVRFRYPISKEWQNRKLAKPVRLTFYVMVRSGQHTTKVIGKSETVQFGPAA